MSNYDELSKIANASYAETNDIRLTMKETGLSFGEVWEMVALKITSTSRSQTRVR